MSKEYRENYVNEEEDSITSYEMREHCQRPGKIDKDGNVEYFTEQSHKSECDVNKIIRKYDKNGLINHVSKIEAQFGDVSGIEFKSAQDKVIAAKAMFNELPSDIRKRFENNPASLLTFMDDADNRQEAIELGIINPDWTEATDGMGEHVKAGENVKKVVVTDETSTE